MSPIPNPYPPRFLDLLEGVPDPGRVLDCGSGGRARLSPRMHTLDLVDHPRVTTRGSVLALPYRTGSFELVLSQAVLEHVPDPQAAVDEMLRVLVPGGVLYVEAAAWQPIHQEPHHYFGITTFGLQHLLRSARVIDSGTLGRLDELFAWIAAELNMGATIGRGAVANFTAQLAAVEDLGDPELRYRFCSGVWATAIKETP